MSEVDLFVHGSLSKNGHFTYILGVVHYPIGTWVKILKQQHLKKFIF